MQVLSFEFGLHWSSLLPAFSRPYPALRVVRHPLALAYAYPTHRSGVTYHPRQIQAEVVRSEQDLSFAKIKSVLCQEGHHGKVQPVTIVPDGFLCVGSGDAELIARLREMGIDPKWNLSGNSMSVTPTSEGKSPQGWESESIPLPPRNLPYDDGETLESNRHRIAMNTLIESLQQAWAERNDFFTGGNMFVYFSADQVRNQDFRGPDFFVVVNIDGSYPRQSWIVWEEGGRYPDVIVELLSPKTASEDLGTKKDIYEQVFKTREYFVFDPFDSNSLRGWRLNENQSYEPLVASERGWLWCRTLGFWLGTWSGTIKREPAVWLRFYDEKGQLVLLPEEAAQQQGLQQGAQRPLLRLLQRRFGSVPSEVQVSLQAMSVEQLEELVEVALEVESLDELVHRLSTESEND